MSEEIARQETAPSRSARPDLRATYRLQFHRGFTFDDAEALVPYLAELGISHLYASPITTAVPGSTHGYDVADPTQINPELGGREGFERLALRLAEHGMGVILDIVPNHMAASTRNPFWMAMLENGPNSPAAKLFDVFWETGKLLLPVLGDPLRETLQTGQLALRIDGEAGRIVVAYAEHGFPVRPESVAELMAAARVSGELDELNPEEKAQLDRVLASADITALIEAQHWRLGWWRMAAHDLNYRRFFNITELVGVRVEDPEVFDLVHRLPLKLLRRGLIHGLRIDHIDGLVNPAGYSAQLRAAVGSDVPLFIEKILEPGESLRDWPIDGTTGYERLNDINGLFVDEAGYRALENGLRSRHLLTGTSASRLADAKRQVLGSSLTAEVDALTVRARDGLDVDIRAGDLTEASIRQAVVALVVHCPVYRSYATWNASDGLDERVWEAIRAAMATAEDPMVNAAGAVLLERLRKPVLDSDREFRLRFQQLTGPAMAKGFEDTELYRHPVLMSVNEVGGSLEHPAHGTDEMHAINSARGEARARDLIPLATHDTKRGPDTRARLTALSFRPELWLGFLAETEEVSGALTQLNAGVGEPDALDRVMILQTLISAWPISEERIATYLTKALREAKRHTNWETPDEAYEAASLAFARSVLNAEGAAQVRRAIERLVAGLEPATRIVRLCQTVLQHTLPGTPDIYQGTEFRDFSLVDPDNRRPVDWAARQAALAGNPGADAADVETFELTRQLLKLRHSHAALRSGDYTPLELPSSPWRWFGFERLAEGSFVRVVVPTRVPMTHWDIAAVPFPDIADGREWTELDPVRAERPYLILGALQSNAARH